MKKNYLYGFHAIKTLLQVRPYRLLEIYLAQERQDARAQEIERLAKSVAVPVIFCPRADLNTMCSERHQGVLGQLTDEVEWQEPDLLHYVKQLSSPALLLVLDGITDPHNLGAILRSAEAAGVHAVIAPKDRSVGINPTVRKVASGAADIIPFVQVNNLARALQNLQQLGIWIVGTDNEAEKSFYDLDLQLPLALVMGAEGQGMRRLTRENCDFLVHLPMAGVISSLNVSVSTAICLFEAVRQRKNFHNSGSIPV